MALTLAGPGAVGGPTLLALTSAACEVGKFTRRQMALKAAQQSPQLTAKVAAGDPGFLCRGFWRLRGNLRPRRTRVKKTAHCC